MRCFVGFADVDKLVANTVGDDIRVQGFLLTLLDQAVGWEEGGLGCLASITASHKVHGWNTLSEVDAVCDLVVASCGRLLGVDLILSVVSHNRDSWCGGGVWCCDWIASDGYECCYSFAGGSCG